MNREHSFLNLALTALSSVSFLMTATAANSGRCEPNMPVKQKIFPATLYDVSITSGPFLHAHEMYSCLLISMVPDRFLSCFRSMA